LVIGCSDSGDSSASSSETANKTVPPGYIGVWTGQDGSTVTFRNDWSGDYKSGGKSVSGGSFEIDETAREIRFTMLGFDAGKYKIDQAPANNKMKLDGMEYRRTGGFDTSDSDTSANAPVGEVPPEKELRPLVKDTLTNFSRGIQKKDFSDFYATVAETWQQQTTVAELNEAFSPLFKQNFNFIPESEASLKFSPKPAFDTDQSLKLFVNYSTATGRTATFRLRYIKEDAGWKLLGIELNPKTETN